MSKKQRHLKRYHRKQSESKAQIALATQERLILTIAILIALLAGLFFSVGDIFWPAWMIEYREVFIALLAFLVIFLALMSPIIIEFNSDPRSLSGPGRNPEIDLTDMFR